MTSLFALWLPILVSAVLVFLASAVIHMAPLWHRNTYPQAPDEEGVRNALRPLAIPPGEYMVPRACSSEERKSPDYLRKLEQGPVLMMTVMPNRMPSMGKSLGLWFVYLLIVGWLAAYIASRALPPAAEYLQVFQMAGATAFIAYSVALIEMSIWYQRSWSMTVKALVDGLIYALLTGGVFGWLWPEG
jgi:hypothetical protein